MDIHAELLVNGSYFHAQPMVEYLDWKDESGLQARALVSERCHDNIILLDTSSEKWMNASPRKPVHLPSGLELSSADQVSLGSGAPDYVAFLAKFGAKQLGEVSTRNTKVGWRLTHKVDIPPPCRR